MKNLTCTFLLLSAQKALKEGLKELKLVFNGTDNPQKLRIGGGRKAGKVGEIGKGFHVFRFRVEKLYDPNFLSRGQNGK